MSVVMVTVSVVNLLGVLSAEEVGSGQLNCLCSDVIACTTSSITAARCLVGGAMGGACLNDSLMIVNKTTLGIHNSVPYRVPIYTAKDYLVCIRSISESDL